MQAAIGLGHLWITLQVVLNIDIARELVIVRADDALRAIVADLQTRAYGANVTHYIRKPLIRGVIGATAAILVDQRGHVGLIALLFVV